MFLAHSPHHRRRRGPIVQERVLTPASRALRGPFDGSEPARVPRVPSIEHLTGCKQACDLMTLDTSSCDAELYARTSCQHDP